MPRPTVPATPARSTPTENAPVHSLRHRNLKASIWRNETKNGPMYKVMVVRSYRENDQWRDTHGFGFDELMNVAKLFLDAHSWIAAEREKDSANRPRPAQAAKR